MCVSICESGVGKGEVELSVVGVAAIEAMRWDHMAEGTGVK